MANLPIELAKIKENIEELAKGYGLDFFKTIFEMLDFEKLNEVAAYGGFPTRYPHWTFGMEYDQLSKGYEYGLSKIYEMVINNDPCYAYLLKSNPIVDQKLVMAHVYGHGDFFKNNYWFSKTDRKMMNTTANHATKVRRYIDKYGHDMVEEFIDQCLSIENLIDMHSVFIQREKPKEQSFKTKSDKSGFEKYMEPGTNKKVEDTIELRDHSKAPIKDILGYFIEYAPLEDWQRDILKIVRKEAYYFAPQGQTKIMNEGWASYWHSKMMTKHILSASEVIDYADHHSGTLATAQGKLNPYKLGIELFRDIEDRWNKGKFGRGFDECTDMAEKRSWDQKLGQGRDKIFEVRKVYNDVMFIDEFLTEEFCLKHKLFSFEYNPHTTQYEIFSRAFKTVKNKLLSSLTNRGQPFVYVKDGNFENRGELLLWHRHEGIDLKVDWAYATLENLFKIWKKPVHLLTKLDDKGKVFIFDGQEHVSKNTEEKPEN